MGSDGEVSGEVSFAFDVGELQIKTLSAQLMRMDASQPARVKEVLTGAVNRQILRVRERSASWVVCLPVLFSSWWVEMLASVRY